MAEQRPPGSGGTSPAPERGTQGRETTPEVSTQITETARHVGEAASQAYEQGRQQLAGWEQSFEENIRAKPLQSVCAGHGDWSAPGITLEEIAGGRARRLVRGRSARQGLHVDRDQRDCSPASRHTARASRRQEGGV